MCVRPHPKRLSYKHYTLLRTAMFRDVPYVQGSSESLITKYSRPLKEGMTYLQTCGPNGVQ